MSHTQAILEFAWAEHRLPESVRADALRLLADTLAVGAAGTSVSHIFDISPRARGRLLDASGQLPAESAAFANAFAIHSFEWDAVHEGAVVHAMSVVTAALLAMSDQRRGSDAEHFLTCLAVGVDIAAGMGIAATGPMKFFRPATAGVIGAALASARLAGISRDYFGDVLGYAYSFTAGTMQAHVEASTALPLQIASAARSAVTAVELVAHSILSGPHDALEGPFGYSALIEPLDLARYTSTLGEVWRISEMSIKPFPSGRASHGALGVLQDLALAADAIESIELFAPPLIHRLIGRPYRADAPLSYQRLCLPFLAPLMLREGRIDPHQTQTDAALASRVRVTLDDNPDGNAMSPQRLVVTLKSGEHIERFIPATLGSPAAPLNAAQEATKFALCRELARNCDPRIFDDPLSYAVVPT